LSDDRDPGPSFLKRFALLALAWGVPVALFFFPQFLDATGLCWGGLKDRECVNFGVGLLETAAIFTLLPISVLLLLSITVLVIVSSVGENIDRARAAKNKRSLP
jgi:hypothetical protein